MKKRAAVLLAVATALTATATVAVPATSAATAPSVARTAGAAGTGTAGTAGPGTGPGARAAALTWKGCATARYPGLQCASLAVPLDHAHPEGRTITLALTRVPHTARTSQGPLLVNPGGPGGSGRGLAGFVAASLPKEVAAQYDVIGFDPRGVGKSEPALNCGQGHFNPVRPDPVPLTEAVERANLDRVAAFARECQAMYADVLPYIGTLSAAEDMDLVRRALGSERISYFGYSYGTYLGAVYAKLHPDRVRRLVLDSVVNPGGVWYEDNIDQDVAFDARHKAFLAWVAKYDDRYGLGSDPEAVETAWYRMRREVRDAPAGGKVGPAELEDTFLPGGYFNGYWPALAEAFAAYVRDRDEKPLVTAYEKFGAVDPAAGNSYSVYSAVQCRDSAWPRDWNRWRGDMWRTHAKAPFMTWNNAWYNAPCAFWGTPSLELPDVTNTALPPALLFQATEDAATPYAGAVEMRSRLAGAALVVEEGGGNHGISLSGNACLDAHLVAYLKDGTLPRAAHRSRFAPDASCAAQPEPKPAATRALPPSSGGAALHGLLGFRG
ncbi:alpha/beta hydrolase [Streptomyces sp. NPDC093225]|uniref:alpha/beta hydrolase n=1 Tax=Streptomyces sp. NPDC093225 TaxID=3366034 RepID=UPI0037F17139